LFESLIPCITERANKRYKALSDIYQTQRVAQLRALESFHALRFEGIGRMRNLEFYGKDMTAEERIALIDRVVESRRELRQRLNEYLDLCDEGRVTLMKMSSADDRTYLFRNDLIRKSRAAC